MNKAGPIKMWNRKTTFSVYGGLDFSIDMIVISSYLQFKGTVHFFGQFHGKLISLLAVHWYWYLHKDS